MGMDKATWTKTRHPACRASGVEKCLDEWSKFCPAKISDLSDPKKARTMAALDPKAAAAAAKGLDMALTKAANLLKKAKLFPKKIEETDALIQSWQKDVQQYRKDIAKHIQDYPKRKAAADRFIAEVREIFDRASAAVKELEDYTHDVKRSVAQGSKEIRAGTAMDWKKARRYLEGEREQLWTCYKAVDIEAKNCRGNNVVAEFRRLGGEKLVKTYGLWSTDEAAYAKIFQDITRGFNDLQVMVRKVGGRAEKQALAIDDLLTETDKVIDSFTKATTITLRLGKGIESQATAAKSFILKDHTPGIFKWKAEDVQGDPEMIKKMKHAALGQIDVINQKVFALSKILKNVGSMYKKTDTSLKSIRLEKAQEKQVAPIRVTIDKDAQALGSQIDAWIGLHVKAQKHAERYVLELEAMEKSNV